MRLDLVAFFPRQAIPMPQRLLGFDYSRNRLLSGAALHLRPKGRRDVDIANRYLLESHHCLGNLNGRTNSRLAMITRTLRGITPVLNLVDVVLTLKPAISPR